MKLYFVQHGNGLRIRSDGSPFLISINVGNGDAGEESSVRIAVDRATGLRVSTAGLFAPDALEDLAKVFDNPTSRGGRCRGRADRGDILSHGGAGLQIAFARV